MTTRYRVEYALKTHRRDQFIEWIKALLAVPFVLHSQPAAVLAQDDKLTSMAENAHRRYAEIMSDVETMIDQHILSSNHPHPSKLKLLVPTIGNFFTPLPLRRAFEFQDTKRRISSRRFVSPSFNDVRIILNTAQLIALGSNVQLMTFDGDVTLYDDGQSLRRSDPIVKRLLALLRRGVRIGIVTAAGYTEPEKYHGRLFGLLDAIRASEDLTPAQKNNLIVMGGESSYLLRYDDTSACSLSLVPRSEWVLTEMHAWTDGDIQELLDIAEGALRDCVYAMGMDALVLRKERAVGIIPHGTQRFPREQLEETVLVTQKVLETSDVGKRLPFCAFNGGNDVFVDIGDKSWGVLACQRYFGGIAGSATLHVGDQFLSAGANDFKARLACTTAWIASPAETVTLLDELTQLHKQEN